MSYSIRIDDRAQREIDECAAWMKGYSEDFMLAQLDRIEAIFRGTLARSPAMWSYFFITGAPYRAYLFKVGRRTSYWIVYKIDEEAQRVEILRFWNASRDTKAFAV